MIKQGQDNSRPSLYVLYSGTKTKHRTMLACPVHHYTPSTSTKPQYTSEYTW